MRLRLYVIQVTRRRRGGRDINGIVLLDKPRGITSNKALQQVTRLFGANKAGHTGSLDPLATGLLPICLGEATKVSGFLLDADKSYVTVCQLGVRTNSADADGDVIMTRPVCGVTESVLKQVFTEFIGDIQQVPPMYSAIKKNGVPLYKFARQGIDIERQARRISVYSLELLRLQAETLKLAVHCSKGTYVRTLVDEIGERLNCGAHIVELRRTQLGPFKANQMVPMAQLERLAAQGMEHLTAKMLNIDTALVGWPEVRLSTDAVFFIQRGQPVFVPKQKDTGFVRLYSDTDSFIGIGHVMDDGRVAPKRLMNIAEVG